MTRENNKNKNFEYSSISSAEEECTEDDKRIIENNSFEDNSLSVREKGVVFGFVVIGIILFSILFKYIF